MMTEALPGEDVFFFVHDMYLHVSSVIKLEQPESNKMTTRGSELRAGWLSDNERHFCVSECQATAVKDLFFVKTKNKQNTNHRNVNLAAFFFYGSE